MVGDYDPFASHNHSVTTLPDKGREKEKRSQRERPNCDSALSTVELDDADGETETSASASACYWEPVEVDDAPAQGFPDFNEHRIPTAAEIWEACSAELIDEEGTWIRFRELFPPAPLDKDERKKPPPQTVVFFIRGLICGQCQDYMRTIAQLDTKAIADANVNVAIVTNGSWKGIRRYREILNCPFPMYTDPTLDVYAAWVSHNWVRTRRVFYRDLTPLIRMMPDPSRLNTLVSIFKGPNPRAAYHRRPAFAQAVVGLKVSLLLTLVGRLAADMEERRPPRRHGYRLALADGRRVHSCPWVSLHVRAPYAQQVLARVGG
jgi:hypothetical protein